MRHFRARLMLGFYAVVNVVLGLMAVTNVNWLGMGCLLTTSLFMSIMFPTIFALGVKGMGEKTKTAGSLMVMAILGGAVLTKLMGILADARGLPTAYLVPVVCFVAVGLFAWLGGERNVSEAVS
jgi:FHS family L-fucose permease-like MFS transporter